MHVAIDLGEKRSYLACWESGREMDDAIIKVSIPGLADFTANSDSFTRNPQNIQNYFLRLRREYLLPSRQPLESAALAVPEILPLSARAEMLRAAEETLGLEEAKIIPRPLAIVAGYNLQNRSHPLRGDVLLLQARELGLDCTWLSITETAGIILETQIRADLAEVVQELATHGCQAQATGRFDYVLAAADLASAPGIEEFLATLPGNPQVIYETALGFKAVQGLFGALLDKEVDPVSRLSFIYPYDFYLVPVRTDNTPARLHKIPFDTANMELASDGIYRLTNLVTCCPEILALASMRLQFSIYEVPAGFLPGPDIVLNRNQQVFELDSPRDDLPPQMIVILDMAAAELHLELDQRSNPGGIPGSEALRLRLAANQERLLHWLRSQGGNDNLVRDWEEHLASPPSSSSSLGGQLQSTLFQLDALSHLWLNN